jgi:hypothetical protein
LHVGYGKFWNKIRHGKFQKIIISIENSGRCIYIRIHGNEDNVFGFGFIKILEKSVIWKSNLLKSLADDEDL